MYTYIHIYTYIYIHIYIGQGDRCAHVDYARGDSRGACVSFVIVIILIIIGNNNKTYFTLVNFRYYVFIGHTYLVLVALISDLTLLPWFADGTCELTGG